LSGSAWAGPIDAALSASTDAILEAMMWAPQPGFDIDERSGFAAPVGRDVSFREHRVLGGRVRHAVPESPVALAYFFHGKGGSSNLVDDVEVRSLLQSLFDGGFAVVAPDAGNRETRTWRGDGDPRDNDDVARSLEVRASLIRAEIIDERTPVMLIGYSAGGRFAGFFAHAALDVGVPISAIAYHQSRGRTDWFGAPPDVPSVWLPAANDHIINPDNVAREYEAHLARGGEGLLLWHTPRALDERRFTRDPSVGMDQSLEIARAAVDTGWFDDAGHTALEGAHVYRVVRETEARVPRELKLVTRRQMRAMLATHRFNGEFAARETAFFTHYL
jgi:dienelactone hydrolase